MVNVIIHGCGGKMGHVVAELVKNEPDCQVVAGIDPTTPALDFPVFPSCEACDVAGDVIIDFSTAKAVPALLAFSKAKKNPCCALHHSIIRGNHRADAGNKQGGCDSEIREYVCWRKSVAGFGAACGSHSGRKRLRY